MSGSDALTTEQWAYIMQAEQAHSTRVVAFAPRQDTNPEEAIFNWETAQTIAQEGRRVIAVADDDTYKTKEEIQRMVDHELDLFLDCFGSN